eukprot:scpid81628/ scgid17878/ Coiled-coil domain-containing protein 58
MSSSLASAASTGELDLKTFSVPCADFSEFKEAIKILRDVDDRIVYRLNTSIPTASFAKGVDTQARCKELHDTIQEVSEARGVAIQRCISETKNHIAELQVQRKQMPDSQRFTHLLRQNQTKLRMMESELTVEEIVHARTMKAFKERCRPIP